MSFVVTRTHIRLIEKAINTTRRKIEKIMGQPLPVPKIEFKRLGTTMAQCNYQVFYDSNSRLLPKKYWRYRLNLENGFTIIINPDYLQDNLDFVLTNTIPHEVAHMAAVVLYGTENSHGHGKHWRLMMRCLNLSPDRLTNTKLLNRRHVVIRTRRVQYYAYGCKCPGKIFNISSTKHNKILADKYDYIRCPKCNADLVFKGKVDNLK